MMEPITESELQDIDDLEKILFNINGMLYVNGKYVFDPFVEPLILRFNKLSTRKVVQEFLIGNWPSGNIKITNEHI